MNNKQLFATKSLKDVRKDMGLTQQEMADSLSALLSRNVSLSLYQKWEQGQHYVKLFEAIQISRLLKKGIKELWHSK